MRDGPLTLTALKSAGFLDIRPSEWMTPAMMVADIRRALDTSQGDLAEYLGYDHSYISRIESGSRRPGRSFVERLCMLVPLTEGEQRAAMAVSGHGHMDAHPVLADPSVQAVIEVVTRDDLDPKVLIGFRGALDSLTKGLRT